MTNYKHSARTRIYSSVVISHTLVVILSQRLISWSMSLVCGDYTRNPHRQQTSFLQCHREQYKVWAKGNHRSRCSNKYNHFKIGLPITFVEVLSIPFVRGIWSLYSPSPYTDILYWMDVNPLVWWNVAKTIFPFIISLSIFSYLESENLEIKYRER